MLAAVVGLMLGLGMVFLIDALDDTLRTPDDVVRTTGLPVLGVIARTKMNGEGPITLLQPRSPLAEAFVPCAPTSNSPAWISRSIP